VCAALPASAQVAPKPATRDTVRKLNDVEVIGTVTGTGKVRSSNTIDTLTFRYVTPGTNALRVVERLPGVNVQNSDNLGSYEWANRVTIRGFATSQIGQTFDGLPLGDMSYGNFNGLNVGRAVDQDNIFSASVNQGSGGLNTASANNLGGSVEYLSTEVENKRRFRIIQSLGDHNLRRSSVRFDTGLWQLGDNAGIKTFISVSRMDTDKWRGGGERYSSLPGGKSLLFGQGGLFGTGQTWQDQFNLKSQLFVGPTRVTVYYDYANRKEADYQDLTLGWFKSTSPTLGPQLDNTGSWTEAKQYAQLAAAGDPLGDAKYFWSAQGARQDHVAYLAADLPLGGTVNLHLQPYYHHNIGGGDYHAPSYGNPFFPDLIMFRQSQYRIARGGGIARLSGSYALGDVTNRWEIGGWVESNNANIRRPRWRLQNYANGPEVDYTNVLDLDFDRHAKITTYQAFVQNSSTFAGDRFKLTYGAKFVRVNADFTNNGNTPTNGIVAPVLFDAARPSLSLPTKANFLPQIGAVYRATDTEELFGNWAENVNQYPYSPATGVYNASPTVFSLLQNTKPERSSTFEAGIRTRRQGVQASLTGYYIDYRNRLLGVSLCSPTITCATGIGNVGSVTTKGIEALVAIDIVPGLKWFNTGSYNVSQFQDNYLSNPNNPASVVNTAGKNVPDAPRFLFNSILTYTDKRWGLSGGLRHVDKRYFNYTNDLNANGDGLAYVPSYTLVDIGGFVKVLQEPAVSIRGSLTNLFNESYASTIGTNGIGAFGDNQTLQTGAPRLFYVSVSAEF
jgi:iron complex outermembrane receptor protein